MKKNIPQSKVSDSVPQIQQPSLFLSKNILFVVAFLTVVCVGGLVWWFTRGSTAVYSAGYAMIPGQTTQLIMVDPRVNTGLVNEYRDGIDPALSGLFLASRSIWFGQAQDASNRPYGYIFGQIISGVTAPDFWSSIEGGLSVTGDFADYTLSHSGSRYTLLPKDNARVMSSTNSDDFGTRYSVIDSDNPSFAVWFDFDGFVPVDESLVTPLVNDVRSLALHAYQSQERIRLNAKLAMKGGGAIPFAARDTTRSLSADTGSIVSFLLAPFVQNSSSLTLSIALGSLQPLFDAYFTSDASQNLREIISVMATRSTAFSVTEGNIFPINAKISQPGPELFDFLTKYPAEIELLLRDMFAGYDIRVNADGWVLDAGEGLIIRGGWEKTAQNETVLWLGGNSVSGPALVFPTSFSVSQDVIARGFVDVDSLIGILRVLGQSGDLQELDALGAKEGFFQVSRDREGLIIGIDLTDGNR